MDLRDTVYKYNLIHYPYSSAQITKGSTPLYGEKYTKEGGANWREG